MSRWDSVCMLGAIDVTWPLRSNANSGSGFSISSALPRARRVASDACGLARRLQRLRPGLGGALRPGEDPIDARVVQPLVGADHRAGERRPARTVPSSATSIRTVTASRSAYGRSEQASLDSASGSIGSTAPGT